MMAVWKRYAKPCVDTSEQLAEGGPCARAPDAGDEDAKVSRWIALGERALQQGVVVERPSNSTNVLEPTRQAIPAMSFSGCVEHTQPALTARRRRWQARKGLGRISEPAQAGEAPDASDPRRGPVRALLTRPTPCCKMSRPCRLLSSCRT